MKLLSRTKRTIDSAHHLVGLAKVNAIGSNTILCKDFPLLAPVDCDDWDFFGTIAAVWSAAFGIDFVIKEKHRESVWKIVQSDLAEWHPSAWAAMNDLSEFVGQSCKDASDPEMIPGAVGMWVLWNILDRQPTSDEYSIAQALSVVFSHQFLFYWSN